MIKLYINEVKEKREQMSKCQVFLRNCYSKTKSILSKKICEREIEKGRFVRMLFEPKYYFELFVIGDSAFRHSFNQQYTNLWTPYLFD
jgi:hypothetical protein